MISMGSRVCDKHTGIEGVVIGIAEYAAGYGATEYFVATTRIENNEPVDTWFRGIRLEEVD